MKNHQKIFIILSLSLSFIGCGGGIGSAENPVALLPIANNDTAIVMINGVVNTAVLDNDTPAGNLDGSSVEIITPPTRGSATVSSNGEITYTPTVRSPGVDTLQYTVKDVAGNFSNPATLEITINQTPLDDITPPVITINGGDVTFEVEAIYNDAGATALDDIDGVVNVTAVSTVNENLPGNYTVTYTATDAADNTATAIRNVTVIDTTPPVITINGGNVTFEAGTTYNDAGATALDNIDGNVIVTNVSTVNENQPGSYTVTYTATDAADNTATAIRNVIVTDIPGFQVTVKTDNFGVSNDNEFTIPIVGGSYDIDCGNTGAINGTAINGSYTCTYSNPGVYTINIKGDIPQISFFTDGHAVKDNLKLLSVNQWGTNKWGSMKDMFFGCSNMIINTTDIPNLTSITDMSRMFLGATSFNEDIGNWDVSTVTNMSQIFSGATSFNGDIGAWVTSSVTNMSFMFRGASSFNQNIGSWDVSTVTNMSFMFSEATSFNRDIGAWVPGSVTDMSSMFNGASSFNQKIGGWDVSSVENMGHMFHSAAAFDQDIGAWKVSNVTDMNRMFQDAATFNQDINQWDVNKVTDMEVMFRDAVLFDQNIGKWNVGKVKKMSQMFLNVTLSPANYDALLLSWENQSSVARINNNTPWESRVFSGGNSIPNDPKALRARKDLIEREDWSINDGL